MQIIKDQADIEHELPHFLSCTADILGFDNTYGKSSQARHVFRTVADADSAAVFVIVPVDNVMATVFNAPMAAVGV